MLDKHAPHRAVIWCGTCLEPYSVLVRGSGLWRPAGFDPYRISAGFRYYASLRSRNI